MPSKIKEINLWLTDVWYLALNKKKRLGKMRGEKLDLNTLPVE